MCVAPRICISRRGNKLLLGRGVNIYVCVYKLDLLSKFYRQHYEVWCSLPCPFHILTLVVVILNFILRVSNFYCLVCLKFTFCEVWIFPYENFTYGNSNMCPNSLRLLSMNFYHEIFLICSGHQLCNIGEFEL